MNRKLILARYKLSVVKYKISQETLEFKTKIPDYQKIIRKAREFNFFWKVWLQKENE